MSSVLYDNPGPRMVARHRVYSVVATLALLGIVAFLVWKMYVSGQLTYAGWEPFVTPAYMAALFFDGVVKTLQMAISSVVFAVVLGLFLGVGKLSDHAWARWPCWAVVEFFRAVPLLLLIIFIFYSYGIGDGFGPYWSVVFGLTLYNGAVLAEVVRAGVEAIPRGQSEAAYAIGMRKTQVMTVILLPQAVKIMLPAIISQMVVALKDTSLGYVIVAPGLTFIGKQIYNEFKNQFETAIVMAALYILMNLVLTWIATWAQKRFVGEKKPLEVPLTAHAPEHKTGL
jgi:glutamate transport system permease protein